MLKINKRKTNKIRLGPSSIRHKPYPEFQMVRAFNYQALKCLDLKCVRILLVPYSDPTCNWMFIIKIRPVFGVFQSEEIFLDMFEDEYREASKPFLTR